MTTSAAEHEPVELLLTRSSALKLAAPGPSRQQLETILKAAVTAPDHGRIRPWRFVVLEGDGRKRLGDLMAQVQQATKPGLSEAELDKTREKAMRAPVVIVLACVPDNDNKVPVLEQQFAVAAAGGQLMLATKALGFGSNWKTGSAAYHPIMRDGLGFGPQDSIMGFFYIGSEPQPSPLARASIEGVAKFVDQAA